jgi:hypothetical protein
MSESHAISALRRKRAELSGELVELEKQRKAIVSRINHADETLRLFGFQGDPNDIPARMKCPRLFRRGQLQRMVFAAIREHGETVKAGEIARTIIAQMGWNAEDEQLRGLIVDKVKDVWKRTTSRTSNM